MKTLIFVLANVEIYYEDSCLEVVVIKTNECANLLLLVFQTDTVVITKHLAKVTSFKSSFAGHKYIKRSTTTDLSC